MGIVHFVHLVVVVVLLFVVVVVVVVVVVFFAVFFCFVVVAVVVVARCVWRVWFVMVTLLTHNAFCSNGTCVVRV